MIQVVIFLVLDLDQFSLVLLLHRATNVKKVPEEQRPEEQMILHQGVCTKGTKRMKGGLQGFVIGTFDRSVSFIA